jgi:imidazolonepropionase-like amidohydrolase
LFALVAISACAAPAESPDTGHPTVVESARPRKPPPVHASALAFVDATVITMESPDVLEHQTVVVEDGSIVAIGPGIAVPDGATRVDARGKFLLPGLHDMHVHVDGTRGMLTSFVSAGVTTVRNMAGNPRILALRGRIARGELLGPTIVSAGPFVDGARPRWEGSDIVKTPADAERVVADQADAGYDFIKVYNGLTIAAYDAVAEAAHGHGLRIAGHVPSAVPLDHALAHEQASIEHLSGYARAIERADSPVRKRNTTTSTIKRWIYADPAKITEIAAQTARHAVWNCPTLVTSVVYGELWRGHTPVADLDTVSPDWRARWDPTHSPKKLQRAVRAAMEQAHEKTLETELAIVRALAAAGAPLLAGTDTPNPYVVPGASLHQELALFVEAGLSPYVALRAATIDAADFLGEAHGGRIVVGARADLVMLSANPLADIHALDQIEGVVVRGTWLGPDRLRELHDELVAEYREPVWEKKLDLGAHTLQYVVADNSAPVGAYAFARHGREIVERQTLEDETLGAKLVVGGDHRIQTLSLDIDRPEGRSQIDQEAGDQRLIGWLTPATAAVLVDGTSLDVDEHVTRSIAQPDSDDPATLRDGAITISRIPPPTPTQHEYRLRLLIDHVAWAARLIVDADGLPRQFRLSSTTRPVTRTWKRR